MPEAGRGEIAGSACALHDRGDGMMRTVIVEGDVEDRVVMHVERIEDGGDLALKVPPNPHGLVYRATHLQ